MPTTYSELLDAAIRHLETLKRRGVKHVRVSPGVLAALRETGRSGRASGKPVPSTSRGLASSPALSAEPAKPVASSAPATPPQPSLLAPSAARVVAAQPAPQPLASTSPPPALSPTEKAAAMAALKARAVACQRCPHLVKARTQVVFGVGDVNASLMFVGEAPGADEDAQGEPFVGAAGQLLTRIIQTMGLSRDTVYIANILKCRPDTPGQSSGNRPPTEEEMETCIPYLLEQIEIIRPSVLVALGATAVKGLLHCKTGITRLRGQWQEFRGIPTMPTYHPAYLLRNQALSEKRKVWEDMLQVMERLGLPISEKQRAYFLRPSN